MDKNEIQFSTIEISNILKQFIKVLKEIKLDTLSSELIEVKESIKMINNSMLENKFILEKELKEYVEIINESFELFFKSINNQQLYNLIEDNFNKPIRMLYQNNEKIKYLNYKYLKYKQKYNKLKNI